MVIIIGQTQKYARDVAQPTVIAEGNWMAWIAWQFVMILPEMR